MAPSGPPPLSRPVPAELRARLVAAAADAALAAYAPYSGLHVGAALLGRGGRIHLGCNVENASYGLTICAERSALSGAVAAGERDFAGIAVVGVRRLAGGGPGTGATEPESSDGVLPAVSAGAGYSSAVPEVGTARAAVAAGPVAPLPDCVPCGACRQVLAEFCGDDLPVWTLDAAGDILERRLGDLLPAAFRLDAGSGPRPPSGTGDAPRTDEGAAPPGGRRAGPDDRDGRGWTGGGAQGGGARLDQVRRWDGTGRSAGPPADPAGDPSGAGGSALSALAAGETGGAVRQTWAPALAAALAAAAAGALEAARLPAPAAAPLASTAASAGLEAPAVIALAAVLLWLRTAAAARNSMPSWHSLRTRGATRPQLWGLVALTAWPRLAAVLVASAACAVAAGAVSSALAGGAVAFRAWGGAAAWSGAEAALLWAVVLAAGIVGALRPPAHFRTLGTGGDRLARFYPDAVLVAAGAVLALSARAFVTAPATAPAAAFAGPGSGTAAAPAVFWLLPGVRAAGGLLLLGAALAAGRVLSFLLRQAERRRGDLLRPGWLLAVRGAGRGSTRLRLALLPALAAAAVAFSASGLLAVGATDRGLQAAAAGADLRVAASWPSPCNAALSNDAARAGISACCARIASPSPATGGSGAPSEAAAGSAGASGASATPAFLSPSVACVPFDAVPLPNIPEIGAQAAPGSPTATLMLVPDHWSGPAGQVSLQAVGVAPAAVGALRWTDVPDAAAVQAAAAALLRSTDGAVISARFAAESGLAPGDRFATQVLPDVRVIAVVPDWPGLGAAPSAWVAVPQSVFVPAVRSSRTYAYGGLGSVLLVGPRSGRAPAAAPVESALSGQGATVKDAMGPTSPLGGLGWLPVAWLPALAGLLLLLPGTLRGAGEVDPAAFPTGEALAALAAGDTAPRARLRLRLLAGWFGVAWGLAAGGAAGALLWAAVRLEPAGVVPVGFQDSWAPLWVALAAAAAGAAVLATGTLREPRTEPDPEVARRVEEHALQAPEPPAREQPTPPSRPAARARPAAAARAGRGLLGLPAAAFLALAARRLGASWPRLLGLGAGILLAAAVSATVPIYTAGSLTRVLQQGLLPVNLRPAGAVLVDYTPSLGAATPSAPTLARVASAVSQAGARTGLTATPVVSYLATAPMQEAQVVTGPGTPAAGAAGPTVPTSPQGGYLSLDAVPDFGQHVTMEHGTVPAATPEADGTIEAAATDETMAANDLTLGDTYAFQIPGGGALRVKIVGVFAESDPQGDFWPFKYFHEDLFIGYGELESLLTGPEALPFDDASWYSVLDLRSLTVETVPQALGGLERLQTAIDQVLPGASIGVSPTAELSSFLTREQTLTALLRLVSVPVLAMALYFVALTASLIIEAESGEIAVFTSRGANAGHVILLYVLEWVLLAIPLAAVAPFPAAEFARAMGATSGFLHFVSRRSLPIFLQRRDFEYSAAAAALAVAAALLPTVLAMSRSVVAARLRSSRTVEQPLWQRAYLDAVALGVLAVAWLVFRNVSLGTGGAAAIVADPALYLLPCVFLAVAGLLAVRFLGWLLRNLDAALGPMLRPAAVLPLRRIGRLPAQFAPVLLLLCFTAALGTYSAAAARTLDSNLVAAVRFADGAPLRLVEVSPCSQMQNIAQTVCQQYDDVMPTLGANDFRPLPAFKYNLQAPGVAAATEIDELPATFTGGAVVQIPVTLVLVDPATFEQVSWWDPGWDPLSPARYLDLLRSAPDAALVSPQVERMAHSRNLQVSLQTGGAAAPFTVEGTVGYWPGTQVSGPMIVAAAGPALSRLGADCGPNPCVTDRVALIRMKPGAAPNQIEQALNGFGIAVSNQDVASTEETAALATPEWAGQSGLLTIGFLVALAVTIVGYLLYAGLVLRGQLSQLGLLRALGLDWRSVVGTVALEQGILVVAGACAGALAGMIASALFLPLFRPAFTGPSAPPFSASGPGAALWEVAGVLVLLFGVVLGSLLALLRRMHVGETVKLEE